MGYTFYLNQKYKAVYTVEIAFIMPVIILLLSGVILTGFYFHDKNVLYGKIYEMGSISRQEYRSPEGIDTGKLELVLSESCQNKLLLFTDVSCSIVEDSNGVLITGEMKSRGRKVTSSKYFTLNDVENSIRKIKPIE